MKIFSSDFQGSLSLTPVCCMTPEDHWVTLRQSTFIFQDTTEGKGIICHIKKLLRNSNGSQNIKCCPYKSKIKTMKTYSVIIFFSREREWRNSRAYLLSFPHSDDLFARLNSSADWQSSVQGQLITSSHLNVVYQVSKSSRVGDATLSAITLTLNNAGSGSAPLAQSTSQTSHIESQFANSVSKQKAPEAL